ncbi:hypothetical protein [Ekhidna sp.]|uniref:hypothetical protein n=1 Tax=Ekhidna sp. TaxID=2608089 RepID=UPI003CCBA266
MRKGYLLPILIAPLLLFGNSIIRFFSTQKVIATITDDRLVEVSGLEESYKNPGYFWTHNDSGSDPVLYLINRYGDIKLEVVLSGVENRDWEEIITIKKGDRSFIYVAEIGDNRAVHDYVSLICLEEPAFSGNPIIEIDQLKVMNFKYAEGARDAEAMLYDYYSDEFVLVTKREEKPLVYSFKFEESDSPKTIKSLGTVPGKLYTAADMNDEGEILLKHYGAIYYWSSSEGKAADRILEWNPVSIDYVPEPQGEAICWVNRNFYTISEKNRGKPQEMLFFKRL